jgi:hypothetical protein
MHSKLGKNANRDKNAFLQYSTYIKGIQKRISMRSFSFSLLYLHIFQRFLPIPFYGAIFKNHFNDSEISIIFGNYT